MAKSYLIKDTTREERKQIVQDSLGNLSDCDSEVEALADMYWDYIDGKKASYSLPSGTAATLIKASKYHSGKGRNYAMIEFTYKGKTCQGWIAASIIGLPR